MQNQRDQIQVVTVMEVRGNSVWDMHSSERCGERLLHLRTIWKVSLTIFTYPWKLRGKETQKNEKAM